MFRKTKEISGHAGAVYCCITKDNYVYTGGADKFVARWLLDSGVQDAFAIRFEQAVYSLELVGESLLAVGLADGSLHFFDVDQRMEVKYFVQHTVGLFAMKFNAQTGYLFVGDAAGNVSVWNQLLNLVIYLPLDCGKIRSFALSENGEYLAIACQDGFIRILDTANFNEIHTIRAHENGVTSVLFHPLNPQFLISGGKDALLKIWDWSKESCLKVVVAHTFAIYEIISLQEGNLLATASRDK
ncbi:MAG: hypothetical protein A3D92_14405, partial [Bacteroidetes bacterium RIFCSPHIGHO2_02_FULL_44_7]